MCVMRTRVCRADLYAGRPGKTLRVGDIYKVVDSSNSSAFVRSVVSSERPSKACS